MHDQIAQNGIVLCAMGDQKFVTMCETLIRDINALMPDVPVFVYTDRDTILGKNIWLHRGEFRREEKHVCKIESCRKSPFERSIFVDVDSRIVRPIQELFDLVSNHDIGLCHSDGRAIMRDAEWTPQETGLPLSSSTLVFRRSPKIDRLFSRWLEVYKTRELPWTRGDQDCLSYVLHKDESIRYAVLPHEYRMSSDHPVAVSGMVKVITGSCCDRDPKGSIDRAHIDKQLNSVLAHRVLTFDSTFSSSYWKYNRAYYGKSYTRNLLYRKEKILKPLIRFFARTNHPRKIIKSLRAKLP